MTNHSWLITNGGSVIDDWEAVVEDGTLPSPAMDVPWDLQMIFRSIGRESRGKQWQKIGPPLEAGG